MQTFLPYREYDESARSLDRLRLGKQRIEVLQIFQAIQAIRAISGKEQAIGKAIGQVGWTRHPATLMWQDYPKELLVYGKAICTEWRVRGYQDTCLDRIRKILLEMQFSDEDSQVPDWLGDERFHEAHKDALLCKDPVFYEEKFGRSAPKEYRYIWPKPKKR